MNENMLKPQLYPNSKADSVFHYMLPIYALCYESISGLSREFISLRWNTPTLYHWYWWFTPALPYWYCWFRDRLKTTPLKLISPNFRQFLSIYQLLLKLVLWKHDINLFNLEKWFRTLKWFYERLLSIQKVYYLFS